MQQPPPAPHDDSTTIICGMNAAALAIALGPTPPASPSHPTRDVDHRTQKAQTLLHVATAAQAAAAALGRSSADNGKAPVVVQPMDGWVNPRVGGVCETRGELYTWTGGTSLDGPGRLDAPPSFQACRPTRFKERDAFDEATVKGLAKPLRLPADVSQNPDDLTLVDWVAHIKREVERRGMDTVFRVIPTEKRPKEAEIYMLDAKHLGRVETKVLTTWIEQLRSMSCPHDARNMVHSAQFLLNSIQPSLRVLLSKSNQNCENTSGPEVFVDIVRSYMSRNYSPVDDWSRQLSTKRLRDTPGENVVVCCKEVTRLVKLLQGSGPLCSIYDLPRQVYMCFLSTSNESLSSLVQAVMFNLSMTKDDDPSKVYAMNWQAQLALFQERYRDSVARGDWITDSRPKAKRARRRSRN